MRSQGKLFVVGIGPGDLEMMTVRAVKAIEQSEYVVGYAKYVERISRLLDGKKVVTTQMMRELERVKIALQLAEKSVVSLVTGGDPSIYGILPLVVEYAINNGVEVDVEVIPGVSALNAASSLLGAAISGDHAVVSLSDMLVPWSVVEKRLIYAMKGDFVTAIYNPSSRRRKPNLMKALRIIKKFRGDVYIGVVKNAFREGEKISILRVSDLESKLEEEPEFVDMSTILIVANSESVVKNGKMLTPRGYSRKYEVGGDDGNGKMGAKTGEAMNIAKMSEEILKTAYPEEGLKGDIVRRCMATTGDVAIKDVLKFKGDVYEGVKAVKEGCRIITDVHMVRVGLRREAIAAIDFACSEKCSETRTASGIRNLSEFIEGSIVAIGNSPSAAITLCEVAEEHPPRFIIATPVGFVNAAESKEMVRALDIPSVTTDGTRGGSGICAAIVNCLIEHAERSD